MRTCRRAGYIIRFPFIKHDAFRGLSEEEVNLYKYMFAPDLQPQTLAIIGCVNPMGPHPPLMEMQCRLAVMVFKVRHVAMDRARVVHLC